MPVRLDRARMDIEDVESSVDCAAMMFGTRRSQVFKGLLE